MPRWLRWTGRAVAGLVLLVVLAVAALYAITNRHIGQIYEIPESPVRAATDSTSLARGRHLVEAIAKCKEYHAADLGGELWIDAAPFGRLAGANPRTWRRSSAISAPCLRWTARCWSRRSARSRGRSPCAATSRCCRSG